MRKVSFLLILLLLISLNVTTGLASTKSQLEDGIKERDKIYNNITTVIMGKIRLCRFVDGTFDELNHSYPSLVTNEKNSNQIINTHNTLKQDIERADKLEQDFINLWLKQKGEAAKYGSDINKRLANIKKYLPSYRAKQNEFIKLQKTIESNTNQIAKISNQLFSCSYNLNKSITSTSTEELYEADTGLRICFYNSMMETLFKNIYETIKQIEKDGFVITEDTKNKLQSFEQEKLQLQKTFDNLQSYRFKNNKKFNDEMRNLNSKVIDLDKKSKGFKVEIVK